MSHICPHCEQTVDEFEGIVDEFIWYHTHCFYLVKSKIRDELQNKLDTKEITLSEAEELSELTIILANLKKFVDEPTINTKQIFGKQNPRIFGKSDGLQTLNQYAIDLKKHKEPEASRFDETKKLPLGKKHVFGIIGNEKH